MVKMLECVVVANTKLQSNELPHHPHRNSEMRPYQQEVFMPN